MVEWTAGVEYWTGLLEGCGYVCAKLSFVDIPWPEPRGAKKVAGCICLNPLQIETTMPLGTDCRSG